MISKEKKYNYRILTVVSDLYTGGAQRAAQNFSDGYKQLGCDSRLLAVNDGGIRENFLNDLGISYWIGMNENNFKEIKDWDPYIIHLHTTGLDLEQVKKLKNILPNSLIIEKNVFSKPSEWQDYLTFSFQMSYWCAWKYMLSKNANAKIVTVAPNPVKTSNFYPKEESEIVKLKQELNIPISNIVIGRVGQSYQGKWSRILINIFEEICKDFDFLNLILVDPPKEIKSMVKRSIFKNRIRILSVITSDEKLNTVYSLIDIFALIADQGESFGNVLTESMLCETPPIVLSTPWCDNSQCEVISHMEGGIVSVTPKGFKQGLKKLILNPNLRKNLGKKGRLRVINNYDYLAVCETVLKTLQKGEKQFKKVSLLKILQIYKRSLDKPNIITLKLIKYNNFISFTRLSTGYQNIMDFFLRYLNIFIRKLKQKFK